MSPVALLDEFSAERWHFFTLGILAGAALLCAIGAVVLVRLNRPETSSKRTQNVPNRPVESTIQKGNLEIVTTYGRRS